MSNKLISAVDGKETARSIKKQETKRNSAREDDLLSDLNNIGAGYAKTPVRQVQDIPLPKSGMND